MPTILPRSVFAAVMLAGLALYGCRDAVSPGAGDPVQPPSFNHADQEVRGTGLGTLGIGDTIPGSERQEFDFDVASTLTGRLFYRDWSFVRDDGSVGTLTVDADPNTGIRRFRDGSDACAEYTRGVEFDVTGRQDTGDPAGFIVIVCDNGPAGSGQDFFRLGAYIDRMDVYSYVREGFLTSGDGVKLGGGTPRATGVQVTGAGQLGAGPPLPGADVQTFEFAVTADLTGSKFSSDWGAVRPDGTVGTMRVDPLDLRTGITAFRDGSAACADHTRGVEFDGVGYLNTGGDSNVGNGDIRAFTVRVCDNALPGGGLDFYELHIFHPHFATRYKKGAILFTGDILKTRT